MTRNRVVLRERPISRQMTWKTWFLCSFDSIFFFFFWPHFPFCYTSPPIETNQTFWWSMSYGKMFDTICVTIRKVSEKLWYFLGTHLSEGFLNGSWFQCNPGLYDQRNLWTEIDCMSSLSERYCSLHSNQVFRSFVIWQQYFGKILAAFIIQSLIDIFCYFEYTLLKTYCKTIRSLTNSLMTWIILKW